MVEPPGTAPGSERFITTPVYRHSRPLRDGTLNIGGEGLRRKGGFVRLSAQPRAWTDRRREEAGERHEPGASLGEDLPEFDASATGYHLARMRYEIVLAPEAVEDLRRLKANARAAVRSGIELHLRNESKKTSRSRIKRLRGVTRPQYRRRIGEVRAFYDVSASTVEILAVVAKLEA